MARAIWNSASPNRLNLFLRHDAFDGGDRLPVYSFVATRVYLRLVSGAEWRNIRFVKRASLWWPVLLILAFALTRWPGFIPAEWQNFSAAVALTFCAGVYLTGAMAWWLPIGTLLVTDILLNIFYYKVEEPIHPYILLNCVIYAGLVWFGRRHSPQSSWLRLLCGGLLGAVVFYLVTNTFAWMYDPHYPKTLAGWFQALTTGLPGFPPTWTFFRNTLLSGGLFTSLFVGAMKLTEAESEQEQEEEEPEQAPEAAPEPEQPKS